MKRLTNLLQHTYILNTSVRISTPHFEITRLPKLVSPISPTRGSHQYLHPISHISILSTDSLETPGTNTFLFRLLALSSHKTSPYEYGMATRASHLLALIAYIHFTLTRLHLTNMARPRERASEVNTDVFSSQYSNQRKAGS
ncbi:hypothetical protein FRB91_004877 [Serendipita sp. 411]|nr:hypothetical protein FRB91_004877 [Serendipita sp. 411]